MTPAELERTAKAIRDLAAAAKDLNDLPSREAEAATRKLCDAIDRIAPVIEPEASN